MKEMINGYLESLPLYDIEKEDQHARYSRNSIAFSGTPRKHPFDQDRLVLISNPYSSDTIFYEFKIKDIEGVETIPSIATESGESLKMVRLWIKKGSAGIRYEPFEVGAPLKFYRDSEIIKESTLST